MEFYTQSYPQILWVSVTGDTTPWAAVRSPAPTPPPTLAAMPSEARGVVQVAVPVPLRRVFDYRCAAAGVAPGARVKVPFGSRTLIGVAVSNQAAAGGHQLKPIHQVLDSENPFGAPLLEWLLWAARYYHHPVGEVLATALPTLLRKGRALADPTIAPFLRARAADDAAAALLRRAPQQRRIHDYLLTAGWVSRSDLAQRFPDAAGAVRRLRDKGLVEQVVRAAPHPSGAGGAASAAAAADAGPDGSVPPAHGSAPLSLNQEQRDAAAAIEAQAGHFASFLLHGVTGSGKTEVYLDAAERCIARGAQVLMLVPEIALTPQLVVRVTHRLGDGVSVLHSALSEEQRYRAWWRARRGDAMAVLGTRSAVFTPLAAPGLILVDEEHDLSYKQQDGFRYHARDLALKRANMENIPVVLGSATPSMESRHHAAGGRRRLLQLKRRGGAARMPHIRFIDLGIHRPHDGLSAPLVTAIRHRLKRAEQSIIFLNRRGFAPVAQCRCGWHAACERCDARLTYHRTSDQFRCHHCGHAAPTHLKCAECAAPLFLIGAGTQRLEARLRTLFPAARISRLDRDRVTTQDQLEEEFAAIRRGDTDIIIGTQLIAKGHDFSAVTLVGVVNADQGLHSTDFRAAEYLFQQLIQVSGRAGRAAAPGEVLLQTAHPHNPTLAYLGSGDFEGFTDHCLAERRAAGYPPYSHMALWRAESTQRGAALNFLHQVAAVGRTLSGRVAADGVEIMDAVTSPMEKLAGRYRAQLLVRSTARGALHRLLHEWIHAMEQDPRARRARWSVDVDPMEMY